MKAGKIAQGVIMIIAILFGALTIAAGSRVLAGSDPGYVVYKPLLIYNTLMGFAYIAAGISAWRSLSIGKAAGGVIFALNAAVLLAIIYLYKTGGTVAIDSIRAMTLRTIVWIALFAGLVWLDNKDSTAGSYRD